MKTNKSTFEIAGRQIGHDHPPLVVAEIGINHGGDLECAKALVKLAAASGAECVKHQTHFVYDEMTDEAKEIYPPNAEESIWDVIANCALTQEEEIQLKTYAESLGLIYISTPFSRVAVDFLDGIDVPAFKIGSGECDNLPFITHVASKGRPVIMSTGMHPISALRPSVAILRKHKIPFALLECTNSYPSPPEIVSLRGVVELQEEFPDAIVGFSDHSIGSEMALASVALGACILERHFTDTRYRKGPDISCSMDPVELRWLVDRSKEIFMAVNNPKKRSSQEEPVYRFARGSVVADQDLYPGDIINEQNIWVRRPGDGEIPPGDFYTLIGKKINCYVARNTQLKREYFS